MAITGHRGLPPQVEADISRTLDDFLDQQTASGPIVGLSCLADGADQLFAEAVLAHGGGLDVIIPARQYRAGLPRESHERYDQLMEQATTVHRCDHDASTSQAHMDASTFMVDHADILVAVWDGQPARAHGGTADVVAYARRSGKPVVVVWPVGATRD
ncbi:hypothetical protein HGK34_19780 [Myceligenerans sp. I2]|uniref:DUF2493 domain-containing protein n=1 Tax=Myceligenerans indicum TaxID=2593663 RepID=A0ABS1LQC4_9MICO|nr:hypothetical protein [Myceligenerans indicum]